MMTEAKRKRFYTTVGVRDEDGGFALTLDGRAVKTPAKNPLVLPTKALAEAIAAEWEAQEDEIVSESMPLTRLANTALDRVAHERPAIAAIVAAYGETDLLCYRAPNPNELTQAQEAAWNPWLDWAARRFGVSLKTGFGLMPLAQSEDDLQQLAMAVDRHNPWELTALSELVGITGSLILGLAASEGELSAGDAWRLCRIDEEHQAALWGRDREAEERAREKREALWAALRFLSLLRL